MTKLELGREVTNHTLDKGLWKEPPQKVKVL